MGIGETVNYFTYEACEVGYKRELSGTGILLAFGVDTHNFGDGAAGTYSTAIIRLSDGTVVSVPVEDIQFVTEAESPTEVASRACERLGCSLDEIRSKSRFARITLCRTVIAYVLKEKHNLSYNDIGDVVNRDHSSVVKAIRKARDQICKGDGKLIPLINRVMS